MKKSSALKVFTLWSFAGLSLPVLAVPVDFSREAIELANVITQCPAEVTLMKNSGPKCRIVSATYTREDEREVYAIEFEAGGIAPSFQRYSVGTLKVTKVAPSRERSNAAPDAPGPSPGYTCEIIRPSR